MESTLEVEKVGEPPGPAQAPFYGLLPGLFFLSFLPLCSRLCVTKSIFGRFQFINKFCTQSFFVLQLSRKELQHIGADSEQWGDITAHDSTVSHSAFKTAQCDLRPTSRYLRLVPGSLGGAKGCQVLITIRSIHFRIDQGR